MRWTEESGRYYPDEGDFDGWIVWYRSKNPGNVPEDAIAFSLFQAEMQIRCNVGIRLACKDGIRKTLSRFKASEISEEKFSFLMSASLRGMDELDRMDGDARRFIARNSEQLSHPLYTEPLAEVNWRIRRREELEVNEVAQLAESVA